MKSYFINFFNYDRYANHVILDAVIKAGSPAKPVQLMHHLLTAQQIWYNRCKGLPPVAGTLWTSTEKIGLSPETIDQNHTAWVTYIETLEPADFNKIIAYKNLSGESWDNKLIDIITHVVNHGTHHRAQIGQQLKLADMESLPNTDYIGFVRGLKNH